MSVKNDGRYQVPSNEDYQPGSNNEVLKNYLGITSKDEIEALEEQELNRTMLELDSIIPSDYQFSIEDLCAIHERWLGNIYPMAGKFRTVTISKDGFPFAAVPMIEKLMGEFETKYLKKYTPCDFKSMDAVAEALAIVHVEFILIHPFREGNGRVARLLASLMANQAGLPPLNFDLIDQITHPGGFEKYIKAIHQGLMKDYGPMQELMRGTITISKKPI